MTKKVKLIVQLIGLIIAAYGVISMINSDGSISPMTYFTIAIGFIIILAARFMTTK